MWNVVRISLAVVLAGCWAKAVSAQNAQPTLPDTLAWMDSTYNSHTDKGGSFGHGREEIYIDGKLFKRRTSNFSYQGCQFILHTQDDPTAILYSQMYTSAVYTFNLHDIDPSSIKIRPFDAALGGLSCDLDRRNMACDLAEMEFETRNQSPLIDEDFHIVWPKLQGNEHEAEDKKKTFVAVFYIDNVEYADRFAKAFRHAIILCGGKPSAF